MWQLRWEGWSAEPRRLGSATWDAQGAGDTLLCVKAEPLRYIFSVPKRHTKDGTLRVADPLSKEPSASRCFFKTEDNLPSNQLPRPPGGS